MKVDIFKLAGFLLSFCAAFFFSLFHVSISSFSKISLARIFEEKKKRNRLKALENYEEIRIAVEFLRIVFLLAFLIYIFGIFPRLKFWPLWLFLLSTALYAVFFDLIPRALNVFYGKRILASFLPSFRIHPLLSEFLSFLTKHKVFDKEEKEDYEVSDEEIRVFLHEAEEEGIIEKEEGNLIKSLVEFGDTVVREIMTPRVDMVCIKKGETIKTLRGLVIKEKHSRIPVYKDRIDNIEGIIIAKDLLEYSSEKHENDPIDSLIRPVYFVPESMKVSELLKQFQKRKQKLAIVVDEHGGVSGLVTMEDLVEEIVGEIQDEYDKEELKITQKGPFEYIIPGDSEVEEIEDLFELDLAEDDYITIGGMITHHLGRLPLQGEKLEIKGLNFEILEIDEKRIKRLRVKKEK